MYFTRPDLLQSKSGTFKDTIMSSQYTIAIVRTLIRGLVKKFCLFPCNFPVVNGSVLKIYRTYIRQHTNDLCIDTSTRYLYVTSEVKKDLKR